jgi:hypothetical protein
VRSWRDAKLRPANEFAGYVSQVALRRLPTHPRQVAIKRWGEEPAQAGLAQLVARGFNRRVHSSVRVVSLNYARFSRRLGGSGRRVLDGHTVIGRNRGCLLIRQVSPLAARFHCQPPTGE